MSLHPVSQHLNVESPAVNGDLPCDRALLAGRLYHKSPSEEDLFQKGVGRFSYLFLRLHCGCCNFQDQGWTSSTRCWQSKLTVMLEITPASSRTLS